MATTGWVKEGDESAFIYDSSWAGEPSGRSETWGGKSPDWPAREYLTLRKGGAEAVEGRPDSISVLYRYRFAINCPFSPRFRGWLWAAAQTSRKEMACWHVDLPLCPSSRLRWYGRCSCCRSLFSGAPLPDKGKPAARRGRKA